MAEDAITTYVCSCAACAAGNKLLATAGDTTLQSPQAATVVAFSYTGDYRVDTLLDGLQYRWNKDAALGTSVTVTYSFMTAKPTYGGTDSGSDRGFTAFTQQQKDAARGIFNRLAAETGLKFIEVSDSSTSYGQIRLGNNTQQSSAGYAYLPYSTGSNQDLSGDVWLDRSVSSNLTNLSAGTYTYATMVHEIGHALGLKHPGNYNAGEAASTAPGNYLGTSEDNTAYTIMSYTDAAGGLQRDWYGIYDLLALRTLYGAGTEGSGNSSYSYGDSLGTYMTTLYDASGIDTISVATSTVASRVDLRAGAFSSIGRSGNTTASNNFSIDLSTTIENFVGSSQNDTVIGNDANNVFTLSLGTNSADGLAGLDTAVYTGAAVSYQVSATGTSITNTANATLRVTGNGTSDTLTHIERVTFADKKLAFDASALTTAKILGAVFGKAAVANKDYAAIGLAQLDAGTSYENLMLLALKAQLGAAPSNEAVVTLLYTNVVGSAPDASALSLYTGMLNSGQSTQVSLAIMAAETVNNTTGIDLVGVATSGLAYS